MGKTTLSVDERTHERFNELKAELDEEQDAPDHTADSFLSALLDTWDATDDDSYDQPLPDDTDALAEQIADRVAGHVRTDPEVLAREVAAAFDYAALGSQVADDVAEELR